MAERNLADGNHKLKNLLNSINSKYVEFELEEEFLNLNTPDIYKIAEFNYFYLANFSLQH